MKTHIFLKITVIFLFFSVIMPPSALDQLSKRTFIQKLLTKCPVYILFLAYSALPVDEGDEDREAGIGDEEDGDSDLDLGDDPADAGKPL